MGSVGLALAAALILLERARKAIRSPVEGRLLARDERLEDRVKQGAAQLAVIGNFEQGWFSVIA